MNKQIQKGNIVKWGLSNIQQKQIEEALVRQLAGVLYREFQVHKCPFRGSFCVKEQTDRNNIIKSSIHIIQWKQARDAKVVRWIYNWAFSPWLSFHSMAEYVLFLSSILTSQDKQQWCFVGNNSSSSCFTDSAFYSDFLQVFSPWHGVDSGRSYPEKGFWSEVGLKAALVGLKWGKDQVSE